MRAGNRPRPPDRYPAGGQAADPPPAAPALDRGGVIRSLAPQPTAANFRLGGASLNLDYAPNAHVLLRVEGRALRSRNRPFTSEADQPTTRYAHVTSSVALSF